MRIDQLAIRTFKNLDDITIEFDGSRMETVLIGQNGTGKSNVIEAIATIFRDLEDPRKDTPFAYKIAYRCRNTLISIDHHHTDPAATTAQINGAPAAIALIRNRESKFLPSHVFGYYSGTSDRLQLIFDAPQRRYYDAAITPGADEKLDPRQSELRRLFYVRERYGALALLTYFAFGDAGTDAFLREKLGVAQFDSALITLRQADWGKRKPTGEALAKSDPRFWYARGIVRKLLGGLWDEALAPIRHKEQVVEDYRRKGASEEQIHLFLSDADALHRLAAPFGSEQSFFAYLETLDLSDLVRSVRIWVKREGIDSLIPFHEISDGEKQLLSVLGMMRFAAHEESLFLLDEPDTHLNPAWKWNYLSFIREVAGQSDQSQVIMTSHDPLTIAGLERSQVRVLHRDDDGRVCASTPAADPRGLGVAGVLRQIFGMMTTLDPETQATVEERNDLLAKPDRSANEDDRLIQLNNALDALGLSYQSNDPDYDDYLRSLFKVRQQQEQPFTPEEVAEQNRLMKKIVEDLH